MGARFAGALLCAVVWLGAPAARADVAIDASRADLLFSADTPPDCSKLHALTDDTKLPLNVVRLRATVDGTSPGDVRYKWSVPRGQVGTLAADLDLGPADETAAVRALCADFGSACTLTPDKLAFYNYPTILWVAPTCDALADPKKRAAVDRGLARIAVSVTRGHQRLGKATTQVTFGQAASVSLFVDGRVGPKHGALPVFIQPHFGAVVSAAGFTLPSGGVFEFANGAGGFAAISSCIDPPPRTDPHAYDACIQRLLYQQVGEFVATLKLKFDDGSALCDDARVRVRSAVIKPRLIVNATPKGTYVPGDAARGTVHLTVSLRNESRRDNGSAILLIGANVLECDSTLKIAGTEDTRQTVFDFQHCSSTHDQGCTSDIDCSPFICGNCGGNETCLLTPHCSQTTTAPCRGDIDCQAPTCPNCQEDEHCIQVLNTPAVRVEIGDSVTLIDKLVPVENLFPSTANVLDAWTVNTFNAGSADAKLRYHIRPGS